MLFLLVHKDVHQPLIGKPKFYIACRGDPCGRPLWGNVRDTINKGGGKPRPYIKKNGRHIKKPAAQLCHECNRLLIQYILYRFADFGATEKYLLGARQCFVELHNFIN